MKSIANQTGRCLLTLLLALNAWTLPAFAAQTQLGGIWLSPAWATMAKNADNVTFSIINLTSVPIHIDSVPTTASDQTPNTFGKLKGVPIQPFDEQYVETGPKQSNALWIWKDSLTLSLNNVSSSYNVSADFSNVQVDHNTFGDWIRLRGGSAYQNNAATGGFINSRYATAAADNKMHSIMTLVSDRFIASLWSHDNKSFVMVVSETPSSDSYLGWQLDWVYNPGSSVPDGY